MKLLINRFMLRHQGKLYKQGDCVELPADMAISLAEQSAGDYTILPDVSESDTLEQSEPVPEKATAESKPKPKPKTAASKTAAKTARTSRAKK